MRLTPFFLLVRPRMFFMKLIPLNLIAEISFFYFLKEFL